MAASLFLCALLSRTRASAQEKPEAAVSANVDAASEKSAPFTYKARARSRIAAEDSKWLRRSLTARETGPDGGGGGGGGAGVAFAFAEGGPPFVVVVVVAVAALLFLFVAFEVFAPAIEEEEKAPPSLAAAAWSCL